MKVYVTGGTGFIGSHVVKALSEQNHEITVLARDPEKVPALALLPGVSIVKAPMNDAAALESFIKNPDAVIHIALCWGDTGPDMLINETLASVRLVDISVKAGAGHFIFTSSTAAHGSLFKNAEESDKPRPNDFYGATKGSVELFLSAYSNYNKGVQFNTIRPGYTFGDPVVHGASMENDRRFFNICENARAGKDIELVKNDGTQFIWAGDLAKIYVKVLQSKLTNETFYGLARNFVTWEEIAKWAIEYSGSKSRIILKDLGWGDKPYLFNVSKVKQNFGLSFDSTAQVQSHVKFLIDNPDLVKKA